RLPADARRRHELRVGVDRVTALAPEGGGGRDELLPAGGHAEALAGGRSFNVLGLTAEGAEGRREVLSAPLRGKRLVRPPSPASSLRAASSRGPRCCGSAPGCRGTAGAAARARRACRSAAACPTRSSPGARSGSGPRRRCAAPSRTP